MGLVRNGVSRGGTGRRTPQSVDPDESLLASAGNRWRLGTPLMGMGPSGRG